MTRKKKRCPGEGGRLGVVRPRGQEAGRFRRRRLQRGTEGRFPGMLRGGRVLHLLRVDRHTSKYARHKNTNYVLTSLEKPQGQPT